MEKDTDMIEVPKALMRFRVDGSEAASNYTN